MRRNLLLAALGAVLVVLTVYAWIDGGREQLHEISVSVAVPGAVR